MCAQRKKRLKRLPPIERIPIGVDTVMSVRLEFGPHQDGMSYG